MAPTEFICGDCASPFVVAVGGLGPGDPDPRCPVCGGERIAADLSALWKRGDALLASLDESAGESATGVGSIVRQWSPNVLRGNSPSGSVRKRGYPAGEHDSVAAGAGIVEMDRDAVDAGVAVLDGEAESLVKGDRGPVAG